MITEACQRWMLGREYRRPAGETIRAAEYDVSAIGPETAKTFVERHHYSRSCSPTAHAFGLHRNGELCGVALFGPLPSMNAHRAVFPTLSTSEGVTLGRLVLLENVPGNGETFFVARCFKALCSGGVVAVESCSDPEPRTTLEGLRVHRGHVGTIYQGLNGRYVGKTNPSSLWLLPDGTVFSNRASGKLIRGERGRVYAAAALVRWGAAPLNANEDPAAWLRRWRPILTRTMRHHGNHRYMWSLSKPRRVEVLARFASLAYPKIGWAA